MLRKRQPLPDPGRVSTTDLIEELWEPYVDTVVGLLSQLEAAAMSLEAGLSVEEDAAAIRRILHSLKGDSGMAGLMDVHALCHEAETAFEELKAVGDRADMVLRVKDWIEAVIRFINGGQSPEVSPPPADPPRPGLIKTLVIDDDRVCRQRIKMLIEDYCDCTYANNGLRGLELFIAAFEQGEPFRLVTLDIQMPEMNGHETLQAIREYEQSQGVEGLDGAKIIMTTSQDESKHIFSAFREGCEAYVVKNGLAGRLLEEMANLGLLKMKPVYSIDG